MTIETIKTFLSDEISILAMILTLPIIFGIIFMIVDDLKTKRDVTKEISKILENSKIASEKELDIKKSKQDKLTRYLTIESLVLIIMLVITFFSYNWCYNTIITYQALEVEMNDKLYDGYRVFILYDDGREPAEIINYEYKDLDRQYYTIEINDEDKEIYLKNYIKPST